MKKCLLYLIFVFTVAISVHLYDTYIWYPVVTISRSPKDTTICRSGDNVTINCGYHCVSEVFPITWIINGTSFNESTIKNYPLLYKLNNPNPRTTSLTAFSIHGTTTFQCIIHSTPTTTSTIGTVTVGGECVCMYM